MNKKRNIVIIIGIIFAIIWILGIYKLSSMNTSNSNGKSSGIIGVFIEDTLEVTNKYGISKTARIISFNTMLPKQIIRDIARVLKMDNTLIDRLCNKSIIVLKSNSFTISKYE